MSDDLKNMSRFEQADQLCLRVLNVVDFTSLLATGVFEASISMDRPLEDFLEHAFLLGYEHPSARPILDCFRKHEDDMEAVGEELCRREFFGMAVNLAVPVLKQLTESSRSYSWNCYRTTWVYASSFAEAWELGMAWAQDRSQKALEEFLQEKKA